MSDIKSRGGDEVPSARAERQRIITEDAAGIAIYSTVIALISAIIVAVVMVA